jgi:TonB family protein
MPGSPPESSPELDLLLDATPALERPPRRWAAIGSLAAHVLLAAAWLAIPEIQPQRIQASSEPQFRMTPLIMPPDLVRKGPGREPSPVKEVNLDALLARQRRDQPVMPAPAPARPASPQPAPVTAPPPPKIEAPKIEAPEAQPVEVAKSLPPGLGSPSAPPVKPPTTPPAPQQPKLAFETPGASIGPVGGGSAPAERIPVPPKTSVDEAARVIARDSGRGGVIVGDAALSGGAIGEALSNSMATPRNLSSLELLNDPEGVDFKPYLIRILSTVKRNWQAVIPESARMGGRRGRVLIQFAINRDGSVPKLVIASTSGADPLDRAAVAGISASNPFPPLPSEFQGQQIRLQFTFVYNQPTR